VSVAVTFGVGGVSPVPDGSVPRFPDPPKRPFARGACDEVVSVVVAVGEEHPTKLTRTVIQRGFRIAWLSGFLFQVMAAMSLRLRQAPAIESRFTIRDGSGNSRIDLAGGVPPYEVRLAALRRALGASSPLRPADGQLPDPNVVPLRDVALAPPPGQAADSLGRLPRRCRTRNRTRYRSQPGQLGDCERSAAFPRSPRAVVRALLRRGSAKHG
jgi:hypothetical protein